MRDVEAISAKVHERWMENKQRLGVTSRRSEAGEELMVPYERLSESAKDLDRGSVRAVLDAIDALAVPDGAPRQSVLEEAARACEANFTGCDKTNVACHKLDAEAIRALVNKPAELSLRRKLAEEPPAGEREFTAADAFDRCIESVSKYCSHGDINSHALKLLKIYFLGRAAQPADGALLSPKDCEDAYVGMCHISNPREGWEVMAKLLNERLRAAQPADGALRDKLEFGLAETLKRHTAFYIRQEVRETLIHEMLRALAAQEEKNEI